MDGSATNMKAAATAIQATPPAPVVQPLPDLSPPPAAPSVLLQACPRPAQYALGALLLGSVLLLAAHAYGFFAFSARPAELQSGEPLTYRLELNQATRGELLQLPGVGPKMAERILDYRNQHGPFRSVVDLARVPGIGPVTLKRLEGWVYVAAEAGPPPAAPVPKAKPAAKLAAAPAKAPKGGDGQGPKINVNTAPADKLQKLPRIGPVLSQRIIDERSKKPFQTLDELRRVKGIGQKTLDGLRPYATVTD